MRICWRIARLSFILVAPEQLYGQSAQAPKSFDVASVKILPRQSLTVSTGGGPGTSDPGRWVRSNVTLSSLLVEAFQIQGHAIVGPDWLGSTRYEIIAKVPDGVDRNDIPLMLQGLIIERFGLTLHRQPREMPGYALVTGRSGAKLKAAAASPAAIPGRAGFPDLPEGVTPGVIKVDSVGSVRRFAAGAISMAQFADYLAGQSDFPVIDLTELPGKYDIVLYYSKPLPISASSPALSTDSAFDLQTALREQLGLELQTRKMQVDLLIIDHIEQTPTAN
jgi:uncharacterized protein (TIGR03435 family)